MSAPRCCNCGAYGTPTAPLWCSRPGGPIEGWVWRCKFLYFGVWTVCGHE